MRLIARISFLSLLLAAASGPALAGDASDEVLRASRNAATVKLFYPKASLEAGEEGQVKFRITLDDDGRLESCIVTQSSGYKRLDEATCELMVATARFKPVREGGQRVVATHDGALTWVLPTGYRKASAPAENATQLAQSEGEKLICKRVPRTGSITVRTKMCLSKDDWARATENAQTVTREMQTAKGPLAF